MVERAGLKMCNCPVNQCNIRGRLETAWVLIAADEQPSVNLAEYINCKGREFVRVNSLDRDKSPDELSNTFRIIVNKSRFLRDERTEIELRCLIQNTQWIRFGAVCQIGYSLLEIITIDWQDSITPIGVHEQEKSCRLLQK